jgi:uncharacterized protein YukE
MSIGEGMMGLGMFAAPFLSNIFGGGGNSSPTVMGALPSAPNYTGAQIGAVTGAEQNFNTTTGMAQSGLGIGSAAYQGPTGQSIFNKMNEMNSGYTDMANQYNQLGYQINQANQPKGIGGALNKALFPDQYEVPAPTPYTPTPAITGGGSGVMPYGNFPGSY